MKSQLQPSPENTQLPPTPEMFWEVFAKVMKLKLNAGENDAWKESYDNDRKWTFFIKNTIEGIIINLGYAMADLSPEYLRIDYTICPGESTTQWDLDIAIEHENNPNSWEDELTKLLHINCGLRVLIAYYDNKKARDENVDILSTIKDKIICNLSNRKYYQPDQKWLLIFGPYDLRNEGDFIAYKLEKTKLIKLTEHSIFKKEI